jgi:peptidoglycan pentaglycine glycine transferase (the first glycine)
LLRARGWQPSAQPIQFANTVLLDLEHSEEDLLASMKSKSRYNTRLARRRGVTVRLGTGADLPLFFDLYAETAGRDGFPIRPRAYYLDAWASFLELGRARLLLAEVEGEAVAGLILLLFGPTAWYMYGASSTRHRERMPNNLLQWEAIRQAQEAGCSPTACIWTSSPAMWGCSAAARWGKPSATPTDPLFRVLHVSVVSLTALRTR